MHIPRLTCWQTEGRNQRISLFFQAIWLFALILFVMVLFSKDNSQEFYESYSDTRIHFHGKGLQLDFSRRRWENKNRTNAAATGDFQRWRLTKSEYPLSLTVPFLIKNEQICDGDVTLLIIVHTAIFHFERRSQLRMTIANTKLFMHRYKLKIAFLLGTTEDKTGAMLVEQENRVYGDIVQGDFLDTYRNLTNKGVMGFRWVTKFCSHAQMVLKIDDDIFVNIFKIIGYYFPMHKRRKNLIMCNTIFPGRIMRRHSRWTVNTDEFRGRMFYPKYCSGFAVLMGTDTIRAFYQAAHITPSFWVDDVYLFGLLPNMAKISHRALNHNVSLSRGQCERSYKTDDQYLVACTASQTTQFMYYWRRSVETLRSPLKELVNDDIIAQVLAAEDDM